MLRPLPASPQIVNLGLTTSNAQGAQICFTLTDPCGKLRSQFCVGGVCRMAMYDQSTPPPTECCPVSYLMGLGGGGKGGKVSPKRL